MRKRLTSLFEGMMRSLFKEKGIFNPEVAEAFRREILSKGGHEHPMTLYVNFRGHKPETKALIEKMGLEK